MYEVHADQHPSVIVREFDIAWRDERPLTVHPAEGYPSAPLLTASARKLVECMARIHSASVTWNGDVAEFAPDYAPVPA